MKILIIGQAPSQHTVGHRAFSGKRGEFLASLFGLSHREFLDRFETANLIDWWPGKSGRGDAFPKKEAAEAAKKLLDSGSLKKRTVILAGDRVSRAFRFPFPHRQLDEPNEPFMWYIHEWMWCRIPHPSGVNRWWNEPANVERAKKFLVDVANERIPRFSYLL